MEDVYAFLEDRNVRRINSSKDLKFAYKVRKEILPRGIGIFLNKRKNVSGGRTANVFVFLRCVKTCKSSGDAGAQRIGSFGSSEFTKLQIRRGCIFVESAFR